MKPAEQREIEKAIRTMIRLKFSVLADRAINAELERMEAALAAGEEYLFNVAGALKGVGVSQQPNALP